MASQYVAGTVSVCMETVRGTACETACMLIFGGTMNASMLISFGDSVLKMIASAPLTVNLVISHMILCNSPANLFMF